MKRLYVITAAVAALLASCTKSSESAGPEDAEGGRIAISIVDNTTRADAAQRIEIADIIPDWTTPDWESTLCVLLACEDRSITLDGDKSWKNYGTVNEFNAISDKSSTFRPAAYTVKLVSPAADGSMYDYTDTATGGTVAFGEAVYRESGIAPKAAEGVSKPYFEGRTSGIMVLKRQRSNVPVTVSVANSVVRFEFTEAFRGYFPKAQLKLETESGFEAEFGYDDTSDAGVAFVQENYWVNPLPLKVSGSVWGQAPSPGIIEGREVSIGMNIAADRVKPQYRCTYTFDISSVGNTEDNSDSEYRGIRIILDREPVGTNIISDGNGDDWFELNPDAEKN